MRYCNFTIFQLLPGSVCDDDRIDLVALPVVDHARHLVPVLGGEVHASRPTVDVGEILAGPAHGGRVDDGRHFYEVGHEDRVEEGLIAILQGLQDLPFADIVGINAGADDFILGVGGGPGRPALLILLHHNQLLFVEVMEGGRDNAWKKTRTSNIIKIRILHYFF